MERDNIRVDPLDRFDVLNVNDPDGDGFAEVPHPDVDDQDLVNGSHENRTNAEIEEEMTKLGITQDDIAIQIDAILENATYSDEKEEAIDQIYAGQYKQAHRTLEDTPAQVYLWCNEKAWDWYWGAPYPADCSGTLDPEVGLVATLTFVSYGNNNDNIASVEGIFEAQGAALVGSARMGFGYNEPDPGISLGAKEQYAENWQIDWAVDGLNSDSRDFSLEWSHNDLSAFEEGDWFHIGTFSSYLHQSNFVHFVVGTATPSWELSGRFDHRPGKPGYHGWNGRLHVELDASVIKRATPQLPAGSTNLNMFNIPGEFTVTWWRDTSRDTGGERVHAKLETPTPAREFELRGSSEVEGNVFRFEWVGLPEELEIAVDSGTDSNPDNPEVYSVDIREPQDNPGHVRSANLKGQWDDLDIEFKISKVQRNRWVFGKNDPFDDGDDDPVISNSANFFRDNQAFSKLNLEKDIWGITAADVHNRLIAQDFTTYKWEVSFGDDRNLDEGQMDKEDNLAVNHYAWAVDESQLDNRCARTYDSGDCP